MKTIENLKKYRAMDHKKLSEEAMKLQGTIQSTRLQISSKKTTAFDKAKKERVMLAQIKTVINEKMDQPTSRSEKSEK